MQPPKTVLAFPLHRRTWLYCVWSDSRLPPQKTAPSAHDHDLRGGSRAQRKGLSGALLERVQREWKKVKESEPGTLKHWVYRFAKFVLAREDPEETFLKGIPGAADVSSIHIIYPDTHREAYVRRRLRLLARQRTHTHRRWLIYSAIGSAPLLPLLLTPLPNLPLYYMGYRLYSNYRAWSGAQCLVEMLEHHDTMQLEGLRTSLRQLHDCGVHFPAGSWPVAFIHESKSYKDRVHALMIRIRRRVDHAPESFNDLIVTFSSSADLTRLIDPMSRQENPLSLVQVEALSAFYEQDDIVEICSRALNQGKKQN